MAQKFTLEISGKDGRIAPDSLAAAVSNYVRFLRSLDAHSTPLGHARLRWMITKANMNSPFSLTHESEIAIPGVDEEPDILGLARKVERAIDNREPLPRCATNEVVKHLLSFTDVFRDGIDRMSVNIEGDTPDRFDYNQEVGNYIRGLVTHKGGAIVRTGSVRGRLRRITVDDHTSEFQIVDAVTEDRIDCLFNPEHAHAIGAHVTDRVVVYGTITYSHGGRPRRVDVDTYRVLAPDVELPNLDDFHRLNVDITGGRDSREFVDDIRGESDADT